MEKLFERIIQSFTNIWIYNKMFPVSVYIHIICQGHILNILIKSIPLLTTYTYINLYNTLNKAICGVYFYTKAYRNLLHYQTYYNMPKCNLTSIFPKLYIILNSLLGQKAVAFICPNAWWQNLDTLGIDRWKHDNPLIITSVFRS